MIVFSGKDDAFPHQCDREDDTCAVAIALPDCKAAGIRVDKCIVGELKTIWAAGIRTACSCCGHGNAGGAFICVEDADADKMRALGYVEIPRRYAHCADCGVFFAPKGEC